MTLLAAYNFDEASGNILDASGNGRTVTFGGSLTRVTGHTNTGLSQSSAVADSNGPSLTGMQTSAYTIMGWAKRTSNSTDGWLMEFKQSGSGDRGLLFTSGNMQSRCKNVAGTVFTVQTAQPTAGTAYHFACTNDGTTLRLYINGTQVGTGTAFSGGVRTNSTSAPLFDGCGSETWLDDARYYDTALDAATITTLMGTPVSGSSTTPVSATRATTWRVTARVAPTRPTTWDVLSRMTSTRATSWDVLAARTSSRATSWRVLARATGTRATTWRVISRLTAARATSWDTLIPATASRATTWDVASTSTTVVASRSTTWAVAGKVTATRVALWDTRSVTAASRSVLWVTLSRASASRATSWNTRTLLARSGTATWRVLAHASGARTTSWAVDGEAIPYTPITDPVAAIRSNLATATARSNAATAVFRANSAEAAP